MPVSVLSFDLDDTLWDNRPVMELAERAMQRALAQRYPKVTERLSAEDWRQFREQVPDSCSHDFTAIRQHILGQAAQAVGYADSMVADIFAEFLDARSRVTPFSDVVETLAELAQTYTLIALTNGNVQLEKTPLHDVFADVITPSEAGGCKPSDAMFRLAEERQQQPASAFIHIGDSWETDVAGAQNAGWQAVWFNPAGQQLPDEANGLEPPVQQISAIAELPRLLVISSVSSS